MITRISGCIYYNEDEGQSVGFGQRSGIRAEKPFQYERASTVSCHWPEEELRLRGVGTAEVRWPPEERGTGGPSNDLEKKVPVPGAKEGVLVPEAKKEVLVPEAKKGPLVPEAIFEQLKDVLSAAVKEEQWNLAQMVRNLSLTRESAAFLLQTLSLLSIYY